MFIVAFLGLRLCVFLDQEEKTKLPGRINVGAQESPTWSNFAQIIL